MTQPINIQPRSVAQWRQLGYTFAPAQGAVNCTKVTLAGKPFRYFRTKFIDTTAALIVALQKDVERAENNELISAGSYDGDDVFPFFLLSEADWDLLVAAQVRRTKALAEVELAMREFDEPFLTAAHCAS